MARDYDVPDEYKDNFIQHLKDTMDEHYDYHTRYVIKEVKERDIKDVIKAIELVESLYGYKIKFRQNEWEFNLFQYLKQKGFPVNKKSELLSKRKEFAHILVNEIWPKICKYKRKKT
jgi:hypothetical protein